MIFSSSSCLHILLLVWRHVVCHLLSPLTHFCLVFILVQSPPAPSRPTHLPRHLDGGALGARRGVKVQTNIKTRRPVFALRRSCVFSGSMKTNCRFLFYFTEKNKIKKAEGTSYSPLGGYECFSIIKLWFRSLFPHSACCLIVCASRSR